MIFDKITFDGPSGLDEDFNFRLLNFSSRKLITLSCESIENVKH